MDKWVSWYTVIAFVLGVLLSAMVKGLVASLRGKASTAAAGG